MGKVVLLLLPLLLLLVLMPLLLLLLSFLTLPPLLPLLVLLLLTLVSVLPLLLLLLLLLGLALSSGRGLVLASLDEEGSWRRSPVLSRSCCFKYTAPHTPAHGMHRQARERGERETELQM